MVTDRPDSSPAERMDLAAARGPRAKYRYEIPEGHPCAPFEKRRIPLDHGRGKDFRYWHWDGRRWVSGLGKYKDLANEILYRHRELIEVLARGDDVAWTEGEKDSHTVTDRLGTVATSHHGGALKIYPGQVEWFRGFQGNVMLFADDDPPGWADIRKRYDMLRVIGLEPDQLHIRLPAEGCKDITEHFEAGHGAADLRKWSYIRLAALTDRPEAKQAASLPYTAEDWEGLTDEEIIPRSVVSRPGGKAPVRSYLANDAGNAQMLAEMHGEDLLYIRDLGRGGTWLKWDSQVWTADPAGVNAYALSVADRRREEARKVKDLKARRAPLLFATNCGNDAKVRAMLRQAAVLEGMSASLAEMDADPRLLTVANGTLELGARKAKLRGSVRADLCMTSVRVPYLAEASSEDWTGFLDLFVPDPKIRHYLQKLAGYSLIGSNPKRKLVFLVGPTSGGKSTFLSLVGRSVAGISVPFGLSVFHGSLGDRPRPDILRVISRRFVHAAETSSAVVLHADQIKRLTGGSDLTSVRGMFSDIFVERVPACTPWVAANEVPEIKGADSALKRRLVAVPFRRQISARQEDEDFAGRFTGQAAVLAWMVRGYELYCAEGLDDLPSAVFDQTVSMHEDVDVFAQFIAVRCEVDKFPAAMRTAANRECFRDFSSELYDAFRWWWEEDGRKPSEVPSDRQFASALTDAGFGSGQPKWDRASGKMVRFRYGIRRREVGGEAP